MKKKIPRIKQKFINVNSKISKKNNKLLLEEQNNTIKKDLTREKVQKQVKIRNPGIDFSRILNMIAIIITHILIGGGFQDKFKQNYKIILCFLPAINWHNSCFIFISGYIGYKTSKYSNIIYLWFWVFFYSMGIKIFLIKFKPHIYNRSINYFDFFPIYTNQYWFFSMYFGMFLFLPIINKGLEIINKSQLKIAFVSFIFFFVILKDYFKNDIFKENNGNSVLWFLIFYITGAYFGKFKNDNKNISRIKKYIYCLIYILIYIISTYLCIQSPYFIINTNNPNFKDKIKLLIKLVFVFRNTSIVEVLQSISIVLFLTSIKYNKYIAKIITFIGPLVFGVYLIHVNPIIYTLFKKHFHTNYSSNLPLNTVLKIIVLKSLQTFIICIIIDYFRNLLFRICQIRKISILIEKLISKLFS